MWTTENFEDLIATGDFSFASQGATASGYLSFAITQGQAKGKITQKGANLTRITSLGVIACGMPWCIDFIPEELRD